MACMENVCSVWKCPYQQFSNTSIKICPICGSKVLNFFDENPYEHESPRGDDDEEIDTIE